MDPEEPSLSTFIDCTKIEPYISYNEICGIKTFNTINMIDDNESIVFSEVNLDENYKLLTGSINVITLKKDDYANVKKIIKEGFPLDEIIYANLNPIEISTLNVNKEGQKYGIIKNNKIIDLPISFNNIGDIAIENKNLISRVDRINNYIIKYGILDGLPTSVFKEIEMENRKPEITVIYNESKIQKIKTA